MNNNNIEKTINEIRSIEGTVNIKVLSNPYNPNVLKLSRVFEEQGAVAIGSDDVVLGAEQAATFENLTDEEEQEIIDYVLAIGGKHEKGRFW